MSVLPFQLKDGLTMITGEKIKLLTRKGGIDHLNFWLPIHYTDHGIFRVKEFMTQTVCLLRYEQLNSSN